MRIATWNVNSIRSRIDRVEAWLERVDVDVLSMQETKCTDEVFAADGFADNRRHKAILLADGHSVFHGR